jgi:hypothetical protein
MEARRTKLGVIPDAMFDLIRGRIDKCLLVSWIDFGLNDRGENLIFIYGWHFNPSSMER